MPPAAPRPGAQRGSLGAMRLSSGTGRARGATVGACEWGGGAAAGPASAPRCLARSAPPPPRSGAGGPRGAQPKPRARPPRRLRPAPPAAVRVPRPPASRSSAEGRTPVTEAVRPGTSLHIYLRSKSRPRDFPCSYSGQESALPMRGARIRSLLGEIRSHRPRRAAKILKKKKSRPR